jgi:hypothetical protein
MANSPLDPASNVSVRSDRSLGRGHGTRDLGPSDSSDSGSDLIGAGAEVGDANLDSDTDRAGTGERGAVGRDDVVEGADIAPDHLERIESDDDEEEEESERPAR